MPCYVELDNETGFPHEGFIDFMDNHVDPTTGTMRVRAVLRNQSGKLIPDSSPACACRAAGDIATLLVPDTAIGNDQNEHNVLVVDKDNKVQVRPVQLGCVVWRLAFDRFRHHDRGSRS